MAVINDILDMVDGVVVGVAGDTYADIANMVQPVVATGSVLIVALVGINIVTMTVALAPSTILGLLLRLVLINIFLDFDNLEPVYVSLTEGPAAVGAGMLSALSGGEATNLYEGLDDLYVSCLEIGEAIADNGGLFAGPMTAVLMFLVAALMAVATIIILSAAKIMIAVLLAIAPVAIGCTMFKQSAPVFEAWVKLALGFAFVPLFVAAMAGFTIAAGETVAPSDLSDAETIGDVISFVVVMLLGAGLMALIPGFASSLAATNIGIAGVNDRFTGSMSQAMGGAGGAIRGTDDFRRGATAGARGLGVSDRSSSAARIGNYTGTGIVSGAARARQLAGKMKGGKPQ